MTALEDAVEPIFLLSFSFARGLFSEFARHLNL
jgi:hypothetical protein